MSTLKSLAALLCLLVFTFSGHLSAKSTLETTEFLPLLEEDCGVPIINCPSFVWLKPSESAHPDRTGYAFASPGGAGCGQPVVTYRDELYIINACHKVYTRIWTATDPNNSALSDTCHQTIKQVDEEAPVFNSIPNDIEIYTDNMDPFTNNCSTLVSWIYPNVYDNHILQRIERKVIHNGIELDLRRGDNFPAGITTVTYTAYDFCGNFTTESFTINVMCADCHLSCPADIVADLNSDITPASTGNPSAYTENTNCGQLTGTYYLDEIVDVGCNDKTTTVRTWYGTFQNMPTKTSSCQQTITLQDMSAVVLHNCPSDINVTDNFTPVHWTEPVAVASNNANIITTTSNYRPGALFPVGITTIIYTAVDQCGNEATCSFKVSVLDDETYEDCPHDIEIMCDPNGTAVIDYDVPTYNGTCSTCHHGGNKTGFIYMGSFNGSNYYCSRNFNTYEEALNLMHIHGGYLASINSEEENDFIAQHVMSPTALIGLTDVSSEGNFVWADGTDITYSNWYQLQPNDYNNQDYVEIQKGTGLWNDVDNDSKLEFVMEIPCQNVRLIEGPAPGDRLNPGNYTVVYNISDGCGLNSNCKFDVTIREGLSLICQDDIYVEVTSDVNEVSVSWDAPQAYSCCSVCPDPNNCVSLVQTAGPLSGSNFYRQSKTEITYEATDQCGNVLTCSFYILVDIDETSGKKTNPITNNIIELSGDSYDDTDATIISTTQKSKEEISVEVPETNKVIRNETLIYPNPAIEIVNVQLSDYSKVNSIHLISQNGQLLINKLKNINQNNKIDISHLDKSMYFLVIKYSDGSTSTERFAKM